MVEKDYHENGGEKGTRFLGAKAVNILNKWFMENREYPYPNEATTDWLARQASIKMLHYLILVEGLVNDCLFQDISSKQVKKWFANKRVRSQLCCKPNHKNRRNFKVFL